MKLVIVESPTKEKPISSFLGSDYKIVASKGHVRDLATSGKYGLGIDINDNYKPNYIEIPRQKKNISSLKKDVKDSDFVYLATDPDREGEAISYHLLNTLGIKDDKYERVVFNEITKPAVLDGFKHPRKVDMDLVKSQETRRILDRMIGFRLSKLIQAKSDGKSAGRVQSVALKLVVDREREIESFKSEEYWEITSHFKDMDALLEKYKDKKIELHNKEDVDKVLNSLSDSYKVVSVSKKEKSRKGIMPFTTSTLQQACINKYNFNSTKTMSIAQKLYEGINIGSEDIGLISYMRTDSTRLSPLFVNDTFKYIEDNYGKKYIGKVKASKKNENVQDAHEAIRPTSIIRTPESVKKYLSSDEYKVYSIIYFRTLASLMADSKIMQTVVEFDNNSYIFKSTGIRETFDGFLKVYRDYYQTDDIILPEVNEGDVLVTKDVEAKQKFTQPPQRYSEASLIKAMEELGIGRPSTYATTMKTLKDRDYVKVVDKKFVPTEVGINITDKLQEYFSNIINVKYTSNMETSLDNIALGSENNIKVIDKFWNDFEPEVEKAFKEMEHDKPKETGELCPNCGSPLVIRKGKFGEFVACSNYPECKYIKREEKSAPVEICDCPKCDGKIVERKTKRGKIFYGCSNYPKCKEAYWDKPVGRLCPKCNSMLVNHVTKKENIIKCSKCDYIE